MILIYKNFILLSLLVSFLEGRKFNLTNWDEYKIKFRLSYKNKDEEKMRNHIFLGNLNYITNVNKQNRGYTLGVNKFTHMSDHEFKSYYLRSVSINETSQFTESLINKNETLINEIESFDWRKRGVVTKVKDQGMCSSCWAYGAITSLESAFAIKTGKLYDLSPQQLIDCDKNSNGCRGGFHEKAWEYIKEYGIEDLKSYPYVYKNQRCKYDESKIVGKTTGIAHLPKSEDVLKNAIINIGPISNKVDANLRSFRFYKSGVYTNQKCSKTTSNHVITSVGFGNYKGQPHFLFKNSWGKDWGEKGYIKIARDGSNVCGIVTFMSYPTVSNSTIKH